MNPSPIPNRRSPSSILTKHRAELLNALLVITYLVLYTVALSALALGPTVVTFLKDSVSQYDSDLAATAAAELALFEDRVWPAAFGLILIFGLHSIQSSMRMFGPIVRIRAEFEKAATGDLRRRIRLRKSDHLIRVAEAWNILLVSIDERVNKAQAAALECRVRIADIQRAQFRGPAERSRAIEDLAATAARLEAALAAFQTTGAPEPAAGLAPETTSTCENPDSVETDQAAQA